MNPPEEQALDNHRDGDPEVSRRYRELQGDEVPPALDDAILAHARAEIQKANRLRLWRRWTGPFAIAASALIALSILFRSGGERETLITHAPASSVQTPSRTPTEAESASSTELERDQALAAKVAAKPALAPSAPAPRALEEARVLEEPVREKLEDAPAPSEHQFAMMQEQRAPGPPPSELASQSGAQVTVIPQTALPSAAAPSAPAADEFKKAAGNLDAAATAEQWLSDIRKLRAAGRIEEADKQWREFRKAFPDYVVSRDDAARPKH